MANASYTAGAGAVSFTGFITGSSEAACSVVRHIRLGSRGTLVLFTTNR